MRKHDDFLNPVCLPSTLDMFFIRKAILTSLQAALPHFKGTLLDVGCGQMPYKQILTGYPGQVVKYVGMDLAGTSIYNNKPDLYWNGEEIPLPGNSVDSAIATELFEHCPEPEIVLKEIMRVLKPGGILFFTVPFLWPLHDIPYDQYRYTPFALERHLKKSNFENLELHGLGGWDASLGLMLGLWVRRRFRFSRKARVVRAILSVLLYPLVLFLTKIDKPPSTFYESSMITGLAGTAYKPL